MASLGRGSAFVVLLIALRLLAAANVVTAITYQVGAVGDGSGTWTVPSTTNNLDYQTWADGQTFRFGDELVFNYENSTHDVLQVANATAFTDCDISTDDAIARYNSGEDVVLLNKGPDYFFICGIPGHCTAGQKFRLTLSSSVPAPVGSTDTPASGSPRSMPRIGVVLLTIAIVFCTILA